MKLRRKTKKHLLRLNKRKLDRSIEARPKEVEERKEFGFYNLFWGAKVTVQMRVLSAPTFFQ